MLFTQKTLSALEYDKIIQLLSACALTEGARARAHTLLPSDDYETVVLRQKKTADAKNMLAKKGYPSFRGVVDVTDAVERAEKKTGVPSGRKRHISLPYVRPGSDDILCWPYGHPPR